MFFEVPSLCPRLWGDWIEPGGCLEGVWMVSDWSWILPRLYWWNNNRQKTFCIIKINYCLSYFLQNANITRFDGVWKVSGRYQEGVWVTLNTAWRIIMPDQLMKLQWRHIEYYFNWLVTFLPMTPDWPLSACFWGVCRVPGRCLGGVLGCLSDFGYCLGWDWVVGGIMWN